MQFLEQFDFLTGVNPTIKTVVYILILIHLLAVGCWCAIACPSMFKKSESFAEKVEKTIKQNKVKNN